MSVGQTRIVRSGYTTSDVYFGFTETGLPNGDPDNTPLSGIVVGSVSDRADIYITPEPASLVLLALAGLALRRR